MISEFIKEIISNIKEVHAICVIGNAEIKEKNNYKIELDQSIKNYFIDIESINFFELKNLVSNFKSNLLIIILMPFFIKGSSNEEVFRWLMNLEKKGVYFINIFSGIENLTLSNRGKENYDILFNKIIFSNNDKILNNNKKYLDYFKKNKVYRIKDINGTNFIFKIQYILEEKMPLDKKNRVIQIPYGEVFIIPYYKSINGKIIINWNNQKVEIDIVDDFVDLSFINPSYIIPIAEIGFGTNPYIPAIKSLPFYEKCFKTYHIGLGNNSNWNGNYNYDFHFDIICDVNEWIVEEV